MKKLISILLILTLVLAFTPSCSINKGEVSVLWSNYSAERAKKAECDELQATLADAFDRGAYIERIKHVDYDAQNSADKQLEQAQTALDGGASALVVYPTDAPTAASIVSKAKDKNVPVIFLCDNSLTVATIKVRLALVDYAKVAFVAIDTSSLAKVLGERISEDLIENYDDYDKNKDGAISYVSFGLSLVTDVINEKLVEAGKKELVLAGATIFDIGISETIDALFKEYSEAEEDKKVAPVELILSGDDSNVVTILLALRKYGFNHKQLVTHFIPFYTVGVSANAGELIDSTNEEEKAAYSVMNAIDNGFISGAALENDDEVALTLAKIIRNFLKENATMKDIEEQYLSEDGDLALIPYTTYSN